MKKEAKSPRYIQQKASGIDTLSILVPSGFKSKLEEEANEEGIPLSSYIREKLFGKQYRLLPRAKKGN